MKANRAWLSLSTADKSMWRAEFADCSGPQAEEKRRKISVLCPDAGGKVEAGSGSKATSRMRLMTSGSASKSNTGCSTAPQTTSRKRVRTALKRTQKKTYAHIMSAKTYALSNSLLGTRKGRMASVELRTCKTSFSRLAVPAWASLPSNW